MLRRDRTCAALAAAPPRYDRTLSDRCYLMARKFPQPTVRHVYALFSYCRHPNGLRLLDEGVCQGARRAFRKPPNPVQASLPPPAVRPASRDACAQALRMPRVALMFLTKGELWHEDIWRLWFQSGEVLRAGLASSGALPPCPASAQPVPACSGGCVPAMSGQDRPPTVMLYALAALHLLRHAAAGQLPASAVLGGACSQGADLAAAGAACAAPAGAGADPIAAQHLFSVYVHAPPTFDLPGQPNATGEHAMLLGGMLCLGFQMCMLGTR